jgi:hypothetical protein
MELAGTRTVSVSYRNSEKIRKTLKYKAQKANQVFESQPRIARTGAGVTNTKP